MKDMNDLILWCDAQIYTLLSHPTAYCISCEALVCSVMDHLDFRSKLTCDDVVHWREKRAYTFLGLQKGSRIDYPPKADETFVGKLRELALQNGFEPRDFADRDAAWSEHVSICSKCKTRFKNDEESCADGTALRTRLARWM